MIVIGRLQKGAALVAMLACAGCVTQKPATIAPIAVTAAPRADQDPKAPGAFTAFVGIGGFRVSFSAPSFGCASNLKFDRDSAMADAYVDSVKSMLEATLESVDIVVWQETDDVKLGKQDFASGTAEREILLVGRSWAIRLEFLKDTVASFLIAPRGLTGPSSIATELSMHHAGLTVLDDVVTDSVVVKQVGFADKRDEACVHLANIAERAFREAMQAHLKTLSNRIRGATAKLPQPGSAS